MKNTQKTKKKDTGYGIHGVGRRKKAVARVWLKQGGNGKIEVNGLGHIEYFDTDFNRAIVETPFKVTALKKQFDVKVSVGGGGMKGQAEAVRLGISRALLASNDSLRPILRKNSLLTVDARNKERKKYGQKGARRKFQFVKR
ncbi:MAG: 30S ribosomal protein S9 [bacterium]